MSSIRSIRSIVIAPIAAIITTAAIAPIIAIAPVGVPAVLGLSAVVAALALIRLCADDVVTHDRSWKAAVHCTVQAKGCPSGFGPW